MVIEDQFRLGGPLMLSRAAFDLIRLFDGEKTLAALQAESAVLFGGETVPLDVIGNLVAGLDQAFFLEGPRLLSRLTTPGPPAGLHRLLRRRPREGPQAAAGGCSPPAAGPACPASPGAGWRADGAVRAVLLPHMDYARGGVTYGWGFKELVERTDASLFVIVGHVALLGASRLHPDPAELHVPARAGRDRPGATSTGSSGTTATGCSTTRTPTPPSTRSSWKWS